MVNLQERIDRLDAVIPSDHVLKDYGLLKEINFRNNFKELIASSVRYYLYINLVNWFPSKEFKLSKTILEDYIDDIKKLPNITPNGLILPKKENIFVYNIINQNIVAFFKSLNILDKLESIQFPVNIRLQSGAASDIDSRPRASTKIHSDIWAGDPASATLMFIPVLGSVESSGITFLETTEFPEKYITTLIDFNEAKEFTEKLPKLCDFNGESVFIGDPYLLHKTTRKKEGYRISIDFRFTMKDKLESDFDGPETRMGSFIDIKDWQNIGSNSIMHTKEVLEEFKGDKNISTHKPKYPVELDIIKIS